MMKAMEILAPVGGQEQLLAAVRSGADAVYFGSSGSFNARRNAQNFDESAFLQAVSYCHGRGVKVHVTLNTLVSDSERDGLIREIELIAKSGADAVIIQDLGVAALVRECCPSLAMHASTQLSTHNKAGALLLRSLGFSRLVLARELTAREISGIKDASGLEIEVFVHGALCMSMSGNCYMSALLGERSGNRGVCAQPCRLDFRTSGGREYALSLKDLSLVERMEELAACGVDSLKIEGRMKRPEYVSAAVTACRQAMDGERPDMEKLRAVFSRSGFTQGYFTGRRQVDMFGYRRKEDVTSAGGVLGELAAAYRGETPLVPVDMSFAARRGQGVSLTVTDGREQVAVTGAPPQQAINRPTHRELVRRGLEKLGGTPFFLRELATQLDEGIMVPVSAVNALRKEAAQRLLELRERTPPHHFTPPSGLPPAPGGSFRTAPELCLRLENHSQLTPSLKKAAGLITLPLWELYSHSELVTELGERLAAELPMAVFPGGEQQTVEQLKELRAKGLSTVVAGSPGSLALGRESGMEVAGDYSLNILNSTALGEYEKLGLCRALLSFENSMKNARQMDSRLPVGVIGYGYLPVMTFRNCPARDGKGCGSCGGITQITDRLGNQFPLLCRSREYSQLFNPIPLYLGDRQETLAGLSFVTLYFTTESPRQCDQVLELWQNRSPYPGKRTGGLYFRELK